MRTIELGVTITDAAINEVSTACDPRCPDCGREGLYRDTTRPLIDRPTGGRAPVGVAGRRALLLVHHHRVCAAGVQSGLRRFVIDRTTLSGRSLTTALIESIRRSLPAGLDEIRPI